MGVRMNFVNDLLRYAPMLVRGAITTLIIWVIAAGISFSVGTLLGILNCNQLRRSVVGSIISSYVMFMKGVPLFVLLLMSYFVIPSLLGINVPAIVVATITLGLCSAAYVAEVIRAGINAISVGQWQACIVLGYSTFNALWRVILPQMFFNSLPSLIGELDQLIKSTTLFATIGVVELTKTAMNIVSRELNPLPVYFSIALFYLTLSLLVNWLGRKIEWRSSYDYC